VSGFKLVEDDPRFDARTGPLDAVRARLLGLGRHVEAEHAPDVIARAC